MSDRLQVNHRIKSTRGTSDGATDESYLKVKELSNALIDTRAACAQTGANKNFTDSDDSYEIVMTDSFDGLGEELTRLGYQNRRICVVTDSQVEPLYAEALINVLTPISLKTVTFVMPSGEEHKNLHTVKQLYLFLLQEEFDRKDVILTLGGGVVGDLGGFAAATYLRGIDFIQVPTTLLAQTDSSIGGKTAVDLDGYKNIVGAFLMPKLVYMNISTLHTLSDRQYYNGFAEVMKIALIRDEKFYVWLIDHMEEICGRNPETVKEMILRSCENKKIVVERDPLEKGERMILNFGHTIGHAIEKTMNFTLLHGECVALGSVAAAYISWKRELLSMEEYYEIRDMFVPFYLPISVQGIEPDQILETMNRDKKKDGELLSFILLRKVGKVQIVSNVTKEEILQALQEIAADEYDS